jgi:hypothetical protein
MSQRKKKERHHPEAFSVIIIITFHFFQSAYGLAMHYKKKSFCVAAMHETLWQIILSN